MSTVTLNLNARRPVRRRTRTRDATGPNMPDGQDRERVGTFPPGNYFLLTEAGGAVSLYRGSSDDVMDPGEDPREFGDVVPRAAIPTTTGDGCGCATGTNQALAVINARNRRAWTPGGFRGR